MLFSNDLLSIVLNDGKVFKIFFAVHPSSKQRSEGEKVRVGDDAILVSVATERFLVSLQ